MIWIRRHKWLFAFIVGSLLLATALSVARVDASMPLMVFGGLLLFLWCAARKPTAKPRTPTRRVLRKTHKFWISVVIVFVLLSALSWSSVVAGDFSRIAYLTGLYVVIGLVVRWSLSLQDKKKEENNAK